MAFLRAGCIASPAHLWFTPQKFEVWRRIGVRLLQKKSCFMDVRVIYITERNLEVRSDTRGQYHCCPLVFRAIALLLDSLWLQTFLFLPMPGRFFATTCMRVSSGPKLLPPMTPCCTASKNCVRWHRGINLPNIIFSTYLGTELPALPQLLRFGVGVLYEIGKNTSE